MKKRTKAVYALLITQLLFTASLVYKCFIAPHTWLTLFIYGIAEIAVVSVVSVSLWRLQQHRSVQKTNLPLPLTSVILLLFATMVKEIPLIPSEVFVFFGAISIASYAINKLMTINQLPKIASYTLILRLQ